MRTCSWTFRSATTIEMQALIWQEGHLSLLQFNYLLEALRQLHCIWWRTQIVTVVYSSEKLVILIPVLEQYIQICFVLYLIKHSFKAIALVSSLLSHLCNFKMSWHSISNIFVFIYFIRLCGTVYYFVSHQPGHIGLNNVNTQHRTKKGYNSSFLSVIWVAHSSFVVFFSAGKKHWLFEL
jgi:hypothetical protein